MSPQSSSTHAHIKSAGRLPAVFILTFLIFNLIILSTPAGATWENAKYWSTVFEPIHRSSDTEICADEKGGLLSAMVDEDSGVFSISVSRIDHTGNEVWGNGGVSLPFNMNSNEMTLPLDIAPDGLGGVYCAYRDIWSSGHYVALAHLNPDGSFDWAEYIGDFGHGGTLEQTFDVQLVPAGSGDVIAVWTRDYPTNALKTTEIVAAYINSAGVTSWEKIAGNELDIHPDPGVSAWSATSDDQNGVLVVWHAQPLGPMQVRAQRISSTGTVLWGVGGKVPNVTDGVPVIEGDGSGGAYVVTDPGFGQTWAQHLNSSGTESWATGGISVFNFSTGLSQIGTRICDDGWGGIYVAAGTTDAYIQRLTTSGAQFGSTGLQITSNPGWQVPTDLAPDGFGGAIVVMADYNFVVSGTDDVVISVARVLPDNVVMWNKFGYWMDPGWGDGYTPDAMQICPDASGGALIAWHEKEVPGSDHDVRVMGISSLGSKPLATVSAMFPESAFPSDSFPMELFGDYFDDDYTFRLVSADGIQTASLTNVTIVDYRMMTADVVLPDYPGAWDLIVTLIAEDIETFENALGVGEPPLCENEDRFPEAGGAVQQAQGGFRRAAFDSEGRVHVAWIEYDGERYHIYHRASESQGWAAPDDLYDSATMITSVVLAIDQSDKLHYVFTEGLDTAAVFKYMSHNVGGPIELGSTLATGRYITSPTLVIDDAGLAQIVYQESVIGFWELFHVTYDGGWGTPFNLNAGNNTQQPDMTLHGENLLLAFVRDSFEPGFMELCILWYSNGSWNVPNILHAGPSLKSPSLAWDKVEETLLAWVVDFGTEEIVHSMLMHTGQPGPIRTRPGLPEIYAVGVVAAAETDFYVLTQESLGGPGMELQLRSGDGSVFYPKRRVNQDNDTIYPALAAEHGGYGVFAMWEDYDDPSQTLHYYLCQNSAVGVQPPTPRRAMNLKAYPNPLNPSTTVSFVLPANGWAKLKIYDAAGRWVRTLVDEPLTAGPHERSWDGRDDAGNILASGVYFAQLRTGSTGASKAVKLSLIK